MKFNDLALEAAHLKWHSHGGPDTENNGLAMCIFHHRMLDKGALGLSPDLKVLISQEVHGGPQVENLLINFSGRSIHLPQKRSALPAAEYIIWHSKQVFRTPARDLL
jgi:putative restriction endonuclease